MADKELNIVVRVLDQATKELKKVQGDLNSFAERNKATFQTMAVGGAAAFAGIVAGVNKTINASSNLGESINALNVVFGDSSKELLEFGENSAKAVGLSQRAFNQLATPVGAMLQNMGRSASEAAKETINLTKRAADMASVYNVDVSEAMGAIQAGLRGEADPLERFGVSLNDASIKAYALKTGLIESSREMTAQEKTTARLGLLYEQTSKLQGDFTNTSDGLANQQRILSAEFEDTIAKIGGQFQPILEGIQAQLLPIVEKISERIEKNPTLTENIIIVTGVIAGLVTGIGLLGAALPAIVTGITAITTVMMFLAANPIGLLITAIVLLATAIYMYRDEIVLYTGMLKDAIVKARDDIVVFTTIMMDSVKQIRGKLKEYFVKRWEENGEYVKTGLRILLAIFTGGMSEVAMFIYNNWEAIKTHFQNGLNSVRDLSQQVMDGVQGIYRSIFDTITYAVDTAVNYVVDKIKQAWDSIKNFASNAISSTSQGISNAVNTVSGAFGARANGGPVTARSPYLVGERGPELFVPSSSGSIVSNDKMGPNISLNFGDFNGASRGDAQYIAKVVEEKMIQTYNNYFALS